VPGAGNPQALNRYSYSLSNPLKYIDPTGYSVDCGMGEPNCDAGRIVDPKQKLDLTGYLASALRARLKDQRLKLMQWQLSGGSANYEPGTTADRSASFAGNLLGGYLGLLNVETTGHEWDIKQKMGKVSEGVVLCGETCDYYDYSVPGNIQFGYVAGIAGIDKRVGDAAGGVLNQIDRLNGEGADGGCFFCDDPADQAAVDFGYYLAQSYPTGITREQLAHELTVSPLTTKFQRPPSDFVSTHPASPGRNLYGPYDFDLK
jgi:hypothetical protein